MANWFWTGFHLYWAVMTALIWWRWWTNYPSRRRAGMLILGTAALFANALFLFTDFAGGPTY